MESDRTKADQTTEESEDRERIQTPKKFTSSKKEKPLLNAVLSPSTPSAKKSKKKETR